VGGWPASFGTCVELISIFLYNDDSELAIENKTGRVYQRSIFAVDTFTWRLVVVCESSATTSKLKK
jgi:hypothetical protein